MKVYKLVFVVLLIPIWSCDKILDTTPYDFIQPGQFYETEQQLDVALNAIYAVLKGDALYADQMLGRMGLEADGGFMSDAGQIAGVSGYLADAGDPLIDRYWTALYSGINRANLLLENIDNADVNEEKKNVILGQAKFLRAYFYYMLVQSFGQVPLVLVSPKSPEAEAVQLEKSTERVIYDFIYSEMVDAADLLEDIVNIGHGGRVTKSAAWGILAKVSLSMAGRPVGDYSKYEDARSWAEKVIKAGVHELNTDFKKIFINYAQDKYDIQESIWEVEFWGNNQTGIYQSGGKVGINNGVRLRNGQDPIIANAVGYLYASPNLYEKYGYISALNGPSFDLRRDWTIFPYFYAWNANTRRVDSTAVNAAQRPFARTAAKWRRQYEVVEPRVAARNSQNFPLLRYADVLLMWAEADNEINSTPSNQALEYVNHVRRRGYGKYLNGIGSQSESIKSVEIINGGSNYAPSYSGEPALVTFTGGGGKEATAWVRVQSGRVTGFFLTTPGYGFFAEPTITVNFGNGSGAVFKVTLTDIAEADVPDDIAASKELFRQFIKDERARELAFEVPRKWDLVRWGDLDVAMKAVKTAADQANSETFRNVAVSFYGNYSLRDTIWPIPVSELSVNGKLTPNGDW